MISVIVNITVTNIHSASCMIDKVDCSGGAYIKLTAIDAAAEGMHKHAVKTNIPTLYFFLKEMYRYLKG